MPIKSQSQIPIRVACVNRFADNAINGRELLDETTKGANVRRACRTKNSILLKNRGYSLARGQFHLESSTQRTREERRGTGTAARDGSRGREKGGKA